jgi:hypothetical protein
LYGFIRGLGDFVLGFVIDSISGVNILLWPAHCRGWLVVFRGLLFLMVLKKASPFFLEKKEPKTERSDLMNTIKKQIK